MSLLSINVPKFVPKNDREVFELFESSYNPHDQYRKINPKEVHGALKSVISVLNGTRPIAWVGSAQYPKKMKEFLKRFVDVVVLERREFPAEEEMHTIYWDRSLVPITVTEKWLIGRKGSEALMETFQKIKRSDRFFHQKVGEALYYDDNEIDSWCQKNGFAYARSARL